MNRRLWAAAAAMMLVAGCGPRESLTGTHPKEIGFYVAAGDETLSSEKLRAAWRPLLEDLSASIDVKVTPRFGGREGAAVEALRTGEVQAGLFPARGALEAVNRARGELQARVVDLDGQATFRAVLIVRKERPVALDRLLACDRKTRFAMGDPDSVTGALAPMTYVFTPAGVDLPKCFRMVRARDERERILAVARGAADVASSTTPELAAAAREAPAATARIETVWTSPPIPDGSILVRKGLDPALKEKILQFFITYGVGTGAEAGRERANLARLGLSGFRPADDASLDPVREMSAGQALEVARRSGDKARIAEAEAAFQKVLAAAAQRRAADPDV